MKITARSVLLALPALLLTPAVAASETVTTPFPGGTLKHNVTGTQDLWVLRLDLCAAGVSVRATAENERGRTTPSFANLVGAQAAINGDFTVPSEGFRTDGPAAHDGAFWSIGGPDHTYVTPISFGPAHVELARHDLTSGPPPWAKEVVGGHPTLLDDGQVVGSPGDPLCTNRHPRTALGISQDRRTLIVLVVDGRRSGAAGMTCDELAFVLAAEGASDAVNMDGGGSSTMVVNGQVKNQPSDGSPRVVGNHLAFFATGAGQSPQCPDFVDPACQGDANLQTCNGTFVTSCEDGVPIANGDCGFFGAGCSTEGGTAHCVHPTCMMNLDGGESGTFCKDDTSILATCTLGRYEEGDCGFFGASCSEKGGSGHCVHPYCPMNLDGEEDGSFCKDTNTLSSCALGQLTDRACTNGCVEDGARTARCGEDPPPPDESAGASEGGGEGEGELDTDPSGGAEGSDDVVDAESGDERSESGRRPLFASTTSSCAAAPTGTPTALALALLALSRVRARRRAAISVSPR